MNPHDNWEAMIWGKLRMEFSVLFGLGVCFFFGLLFQKSVLSNDLFIP